MGTNKQMDCKLITNKAQDTLQHKCADKTQGTCNIGAVDQSRDNGAGNQGDGDLDRQRVQRRPPWQ